MRKTALDRVDKCALNADFLNWACIKYFFERQLFDFTYYIFPTYTIYNKKIQNIIRLRVSDGYISYMAVRSGEHTVDC